MGPRYIGPVEMTMAISALPRVVRIQASLPVLLILV